MALCLVCAMEDEASLIREASELLSSERRGYARIEKRRLGEKDFYLCVTGIGKVLSASGITSVLNFHQDVDKVIDFGVGGSLDSKVCPVLSALIGEDFVQWDMDVSPLGDPKGFLSGICEIYLYCDEALSRKLGDICDELGYPHALATIASGDKFVVDPDEKKRIQNDFGAISVDMESASVGEIVHVHGLPFAILRFISDDEDHYNEYVKNKPACIDMLTAVLLKLIGGE